MRIKQNRHLPSLLFLLPSLVAALLNCDHVLVDRTSFDLSPLKGPHSATKTLEETPPSIRNLTATIDICQPLEKSKDSTKYDSCPIGTWVCAIERTINEADKSVTISRVIPIAGNENRQLEPNWIRLKTSPEPADFGKEGLRVVLHGGKYMGRKQKAVVEFLCDKSVDGTDGDEDGGDVEKRRLQTREEEDGKEAGPKLLDYESNSDEKEDVLWLEWRTKYACEDEKNTDHNAGGRWGFFTWFIIIVFLATATYLIFGSWLNYNRYGARGWDLLPHGDTIRDLPYLLRDWSRRVVSTVQGGGSRGGYSAV